VTAQHPQLADHRRLHVFAEMMVIVDLEPVVAVEQGDKRQCCLAILEVNHLNKQSHHITTDYSIGRQQTPSNYM